MPRKRIALLFEFPTLNGGERSMLASLDWLRAHDSHWEFVAIARPTGHLAEALRARSISLIEWSSHTEDGGRKSAQQIESSLVEVVAKVDPDLLHANSLSMARLIGRLANRWTVPTTGHLRDIIRLSAAAVHDLSRNDMLIAVSEATRQFHVSQGLTAERVVTIRNGIDLNEFQPRPRSGWLSRELVSHRQENPSLITATTISERVHSCSLDNGGLSNRVRFIATIGQIRLRKGQDVLAAAAPTIVAKIPNAHILIIGERSSQKVESIEFEQAISREFARAGLASHLHVMGYRNDVSRLLNEIDLLVHPAHQEPFGRVLLEATASGVPIVATNVGGTAEIVVDNVTGTLVPAHNSEALAHAVIDVLSNSSRADEMSRSARSRALKQFSIADASRKLADLWQTMKKPAD